MQMQEEVISAFIQWGIPLILTGIGTWICGALTRQKTDMDALKEGMRTMLRGRLVDLHAQHVVTGAGCPEAVKTEAQRVYEAYHALGGNGVGTQLYKEILHAHVKGANHD